MFHQQQNRLHHPTQRPPFYNIGIPIYRNTGKSGDELPICPHCNQPCDIKIRSSCYHLFCASCAKKLLLDEACSICSAKCQEVTVLHPSDSIFTCPDPECRIIFLQETSMRYHYHIEHSLTKLQDIAVTSVANLGSKTIVSKKSSITPCIKRKIELNENNINEIWWKKLHSVKFGVLNKEIYKNNIDCLIKLLSPVKANIPPPEICIPPPVVIQGGGVLPTPTTGTITAPIRGVLRPQINPNLAPPSQNDRMINQPSRVTPIQDERNIPQVYEPIIPQIKPVISTPLPIEDTIVPPIIIPKKEIEKDIIPIKIPPVIPVIINDSVSSSMFGTNTDEDDEFSFD
eukprot:GHVL01044037.1.p1 GENE.GHVL01044037.1~~GHVL01044037.1.p1  ORF type:complete len:343 (+),score=74.54 GHVL01044037.1:57-1085(+)